MQVRRGVFSTQGQRSAAGHPRTSSMLRKESFANATAVFQGLSSAPTTGTNTGGGSGFAGGRSATAAKDEIMFVAKDEMNTKMGGGPPADSGGGPSAFDPSVRSVFLPHRWAAEEGKGYVPTVVTTGGNHSSRGRHSNREASRTYDVTRSNCAPVVVHYRAETLEERANNNSPTRNPQSRLRNSPPRGRNSPPSWPQRNDVEGILSVGVLNSESTGASTLAGSAVSIGGKGSNAKQDEELQKNSQLVDVTAEKRRLRRLFATEDDFYKLMTPKSEWHSVKACEAEPGDIKVGLLANCPEVVNTKKLVDAALAVPVVPLNKRRANDTTGSAAENPFSFPVDHFALVNQPQPVLGLPDSPYRRKRLKEFNSSDSNWRRLSPPSRTSRPPKAATEAGTVGNEGYSGGGGEGPPTKRNRSPLPTTPNPDESSPAHEVTKHSQVWKAAETAAAAVKGHHTTDTADDSAAEPTTKKDAGGAVPARGPARGRKLEERFQYPGHCDATNVLSAEELVEIIRYTYNDDRVAHARRHWVSEEQRDAAHHTGPLAPPSQCIASLDVSGTVVFLPGGGTSSPGRFSYGLKLILPILEGSLFDRVEIHTLRADRCQWTDDDALRLARAIRYAKDFHLEHIYLRYNRFTDEGIEYLKKAVKYRPTIKTLDVSGNELVENANDALSILDERLENNRNEVSNLSLLKRLVHSR